MSNRKQANIFASGHIIRPDGQDGSRVCFFCGRTFGATTSTTSLRYHLGTCAKCPETIKKSYQTEPKDSSQPLLSEAGLVVPGMSDVAKRKSQEILEDFFLKYPAPLALVGMLLRSKSVPVSLTNLFL